MVGAIGALAGRLAARCASCAGTRGRLSRGALLAAKRAPEGSTVRQEPSKRSVAVQGPIWAAIDGKLVGFHEADTWDTTVAFLGELALHLAALLDGNPPSNAVVGLAKELVAILGKLDEAAENLW